MEMPLDLPLEEGCWPDADNFHLPASPASWEVRGFVSVSLVRWLVLRQGHSVPQAGPAWNSWFSCLLFQSTGIAGVYPHARFISFIQCHLLAIVVKYPSRTCNHNDLSEQGKETACDDGVKGLSCRCVTQGPVCELPVSKHLKRGCAGHLSACLDRERRRKTNRQASKAAGSQKPWSPGSSWHSKAVWRGGNCAPNYLHCLSSQV